MGSQEKQFLELTECRNECSLLYLKASDIWHRYTDVDSEQSVNLKRALAVYFNSYYEGSTMAVFKVDRLDSISRRLKDEAILPDLQLAVDDVTMCIKWLDSLGASVRRWIGILDMPGWQRWLQRQPNSQANDRYNSIHAYMEQWMNSRHSVQSGSSAGNLLGWLEKVFNSILGCAAGIVQDMERVLNLISASGFNDNQPAQTEPCESPRSIKSRRSSLKSRKDTKPENKEDRPWYCCCFCRPKEDDSCSSSDSESDGDSRPTRRKRKAKVSPSNGGTGDYNQTRADLGRHDVDGVRFGRAMQNRELMSAFSYQLSNSLNDFSYKIESKLDNIQDRVHSLETRFSGDINPWRSLEAPIVSMTPIEDDIEIPEHCLMSDTEKWQNETTIRADLRTRALHLQNLLDSITSTYEYSLLREDRRWREDFFKFSAKLLQTASKTVDDLAIHLGYPLRGTKSLRKGAGVYELLRYWEKKINILNPELLIEFLMNGVVHANSSQWNRFVDITQIDMSERLIKYIEHAVESFRSTAEQNRV